METVNIDHFNECMAFVLAKLYDSFPVPLTFDTHSLVPADSHDRKLTIFDDHPNGPSEMDPVITQALDVYKWAIHFLIAKGFVRDIETENLLMIQKFNGNAPISRFHKTQFSSLVLTMKGLVVLNSVPNTIAGPKQNIIDRLKSGVITGSGEIIKSSVSSLLTQAVTGIFT